MPSAVVKIPRVLLTRDAVADYCHQMWESRYFPTCLTGDAAVLSDWLMEHGHDSEYWIGVDRFTVRSVGWGTSLHFWFHWVCAGAVCEARSPVYQVLGVPTRGESSTTWGYPTYQKSLVDQCAFLFELDKRNLLPDFRGTAT